MTRKTVSKKLMRQTPVIPPIKEGEELRETANTLKSPIDCVHQIERKEFNKILNYQKISGNNFSMYYH